MCNLQEVHGRRIRLDIDIGSFPCGFRKSRQRGDRNRRIKEAISERTSIVSGYRSSYRRTETERDIALGRDLRQMNEKPSYKTAILFGKTFMQSSSCERLKLLKGF